MSKRFIVKGNRLIGYEVTDWRAANHGRPDVAVLMPYYNGQRWLSACLDALDANDQPHDLFIVDDGSTIPVAELLPPRPNTVVIRLAENVGITRALNLGICEIAGLGYEFLARQDVDDVSYPTRLRLQRTLMAESGADLVISPWRCIDGQGRPLFSRSAVYSQTALLKRMLLHNVAAHSTFFFRVRSFTELGAYDNNLRRSQDYDLLLRFLRQGCVRMTDDPLLDFRAHDLSMTGVGVGSRGSSLRVRIKNFDPWRIGSYIGVCRTMLLMFVPRWVTLSINRQLLGGDKS